MTDNRTSENKRAAIALTLMALLALGLGALFFYLVVSLSPPDLKVTNALLYLILGALTTRVTKG